MQVLPASTPSPTLPHPPHHTPRPSGDEELEDGGIEVVLESTQAGGASEAAPSGSEQQQPLQPRAAPAAAAQPQQQPQQQQTKKAAGRRVAFQAPAADGEDGGAATPQAPRSAGGDSGSEGGGTPYDGVLAMLRQGPLAASSPRSFPRPRSSSLLTSAGRTPGPGLAFGASPSPMPPSGGSEFGGGLRGGYLGSRLGPQGASATPSTGIRTAYTARSNSRFSRTPVHMQPLAAGVPGGSGGAANPTSRFGLAAAAAAAGAGVASREAGNGTAAGPALLSPAPLAWTPMRSNQATGMKAAPVGSGGKRKAASTSPDAGVLVWAAELVAGQGVSELGLPMQAWPCVAWHWLLHSTVARCAHPPAGEAGNISLLDAQRRIRQKSEPAGAEAGAASAERRAWRAGRTPFVKGGGLSRFGAALQPALAQERSASPVVQAGAAAAGAAAPLGPASASKATTDTARRILATLDALDKVVASSPPGGAAAAVAAAMGEEQQEAQAAPSPPPTDSLGFAGAARAVPPDACTLRVAHHCCCCASCP